MRLIGYQRPKSLEEAKAALKELGDKGTPLTGATSHHFIKGDEGKVGVDICWIGHDTIEEQDDKFVVGAISRLSTLQNFKAAGWVLDRVAVRFMNQPMRNTITLGGNIARVFPWADFPIVLLALGADIVVSSDEEKVYSADDYFKGQAAQKLEHGDIVTEVHVPRLKANEGFGYHKETLTYASYSKLTLAVWLQLDKRTVTDIRIAAGAGIPVQKRLTDLENALKGKAVSADVITAAVEETIDAVKWTGGDGYSADYTRQLARAHLVDVITGAWQEAKGGAA